MTSPLPVDALTALASPDTQRLAARMAQDVFAETFRLSSDSDTSQAGKLMSDLEKRCHNWCQAGESDDAQALRRAMLISGLDQWGLAYSQTFNLTAIPALSALIGNLRTCLDPRSDARFQWFFSQIEQIEGDAIDFKIDLRRNIHLALWHAMGACETETQVAPIVQSLGSLLFALNNRMPHLGWRLITDALTNIQIALLNDPSASRMAQEGTQKLFEALRNELPSERYQIIVAHSGKALLAWQQAKRAN